MNRWYKEFYRILAPDGLLITTTRSRMFIESNKTQNHSPHFKNLDECLSMYDEGRFVHQSTGGGGILTQDFYGETCIPKKYFQKNITDLELLHFIDQLPSDFAQACTVFRKSNKVRNWLFQRW